MKSDHVSLIDCVMSALTRAARRLNTDTPTTRNGLAVLPNACTARLVTLDLVNQLRDEMPL